jgi:hypothetical protein
MTVPVIKTALKSDEPQSNTKQTKRTWQQNMPKELETYLFTLSFNSKSK